MEFAITQDFPAGLDRLWAVFGQPDYAQRKYLALGATTVHLRRFDTTALAIALDLERVVPVATSGLPGWARRFVGRTLTLRHRSTWRRTAAKQVEAELEITPLGLPVRALGQGHIVESAAGTSCMTLTWRVESSVPWLRGRIEQLFADEVRRALGDDHRFTLGYLQTMSAHPSADRSASAVRARPR